VEDPCCSYAAKNGLADRGELSNYDNALQLFHATECITAPLSSKVSFGAVLRNLGRDWSCANYESVAQHELRYPPESHDFGTPKGMLLDPSAS